MTLAIRILGGIVLLFGLVNFLTGLCQMRSAMHATIFQWGVVIPLTGLALIVWGNLWFLLAGVIAFLLALPLSGVLVLLYPVALGALIALKVSHLPAGVSLGRILVTSAVGALVGYAYASAVILVTRAILSSRRSPFT
jgi:hypothetical protein